MDPTTLSLSQLIQQVNSSEEVSTKHVILQNKDNTPFLEEIIIRKPVYEEYIEKLVAIHDKANDPDKARETITNCIEANDSNLDLWMFYINWTLSNDYIAKRDEDKTKEIFEEARSKIGTHPQSWCFWKKYIEFEIMRDNKNTTNLIYYTALCAKVDNIDALKEEYVQFLNLHFDKLKELISSENPAEFKDEKPTLLNHFCEAANDKDSFIKIIERLAEKAKDENNRRAAFENSLSIFSYSPNNTSDANLKVEKETWKSYIQSEKTDNNYQNVQMLYKRMMIPFYDDFSVWQEYIDYLANTMSQVNK